MLKKIPGPVFDIAVRRKHVARHVGAHVAGQERDRPSHLPWLGDVPHWYDGLELRLRLQPRGVVRSKTAPEHGRFNEPRRHDVHADAMLRVLARRLLAKANCGPFGSRVRRRAPRRLAADRCDIHHDARRLRRGPRLQLRGHAPQGALNVHAELWAALEALDEARIADLQGAPKHARVVDGHVQAAKLVLGPVDGLPDRSSVGDVDGCPRQFRRRRAVGWRRHGGEVGPSLLRFGDVVADHHHGTALEKEGFDCRQADAAVATCNEDHLVSEARLPPVLGRRPRGPRSRTCGACGERAERAQQQRRGEPRAGHGRGKPRPARTSEPRHARKS
mmetsp:Transcript_38434/g.116226  ORF Transcript_38434/g.116226 Transcript_38434/m.116226 type:complete len:332 (+) Transcript_38434:365-1360(+)